MLCRYLGESRGRTTLNKQPNHMGVVPPTMSQIRQYGAIIRNANPLIGLRFSERNRSCFAVIWMLSFTITARKGVFAMACGCENQTDRYKIFAGAACPGRRRMLLSSSSRWFRQEMPGRTIAILSLTVRSSFPAVAIAECLKIACLCGFQADSQFSAKTLLIASCGLEQI